jgi:hypothetical protein
MKNQDDFQSFLHDYKKLVSMLTNIVRFCNRYLIKHTPPSKIRLVFHRNANIRAYQDKRTSNFQIISSGYQLKTSHIAMLPLSAARLYVLIHRIRKTALKLLKLYHSYLSALEEKDKDEKI